MILIRILASCAACLKKIRNERLKNRLAVYRQTQTDSKGEHNFDFTMQNNTYIFFVIYCDISLFEFTTSPLGRAYVSTAFILFDSQ